MLRENTIILTNGTEYETWGALTEICENHKQFRYSYLKSKKFPFKSKGFDFIKVPYRTKTIMDK